MPLDRIDPGFRALPLQALADAALGRARELGAQHADVRVEQILTQSISLRDGSVTGV
ncbi:MAG: TldD protein, partial [Pseudonocardiales bacterium]|nr:TldD protein [Pseudonocardiales bacterium]